MATRGPSGRMTRALTTFYEVGDHVMLSKSLGFEPSGSLFDQLIDPVGEARLAKRWARPQVGDVGTIIKIWIADPNDGDDAFLLFDVKWGDGKTLDVAENDIVRSPRKPRPRRRGLGRANEAWLRRQLEDCAPESSQEDC